MSQYVRLGKSGRLGRLARAHRVSGIRGLRGARSPEGSGLSSSQRALINTGFRGLGYGYTTTDDYGNPITVQLPTGTLAPGVTPTAGTNPYPTGYNPNAGTPGGLTPADAAVLSSAITAAGKVGTQAIIGSPSLTYNPETGTYTATGGAALPSGLGISTAISEYLPLILLAGGAILLFSMVGRK
jgi:hypothetical protein